MQEIELIEEVISRLRQLKKEIKTKDKLSQNALYCQGTPAQRQKASTALNWQCMHLDKTRKEVWRAIKKADFLEVSLEETEYNPSGFHSYKG